MYSISVAAPVPIPTPFRGTAGASDRPVDATAPRHEVGALRDAIVAALRNGDTVDRNVLLRLLPAMQAWPKDLPIDLLVEGALSGQRFGDDPCQADPDGPVYVKLRATGRYAIACSYDTPEDQWWDCGAACEPDSLFHAVLIGMQLRSATRHAQFTLALQQADDGYRTDAQWLRDRLADELVEAPPALMRALEGLAATRPDARGPAVAARAIGAKPIAKQPVDVGMLQRIGQMDRAALIAAGGLAGVAGRVNSTLRKYVHAYSGKLSAQGELSVKRAVDPGFAPNRLTAAVFLDVLKKYRTQGHRTFDQLVRDLEVPLHALEKHLFASGVPKAAGLDLLHRDQCKDSFARTHPALVVAVSELWKDGWIPTPYHLLVAAYTTNVSFDRLHRLISTDRGLNGLGKQAVKRTRYSPQPVHVEIPREHLADPSRPLWLAIDANLSVEVRVEGGDATSTVVDFGILPALWTQSPLPATQLAPMRPQGEP